MGNMAYNIDCANNNFLWSATTCCDRAPSAAIFSKHTCAPCQPWHANQHNAAWYWPSSASSMGSSDFQAGECCFPELASRGKGIKQVCPEFMQKSFYLTFNSTSSRQEPWAVKIFARLARSGKNGISKHVREMYYATTAGQFATEVLCTVDQEATKNTSICLNNSSIQQRLNQIKRIRAR